MQPQILDLFGEVPVTTQDIDAWLRAVPRIEPRSTRAAYYIKAWNVPEKVRASKLRGDFERLTMPPAKGAFWWHRFAW